MRLWLATRISFRYVNYYTDYKRAKLNAGGAAGSKAVNETFMARNANYYPLVRAPKGDKDAKKAGRALKKLVKTRKSIRREMKEERITTSVLGMIGRSLEPVTQFAGFDWKINVALLSSFAARESSVATLGVLFQQDEDQNATLEDRMGAETKAGGANRSACRFHDPVLRALSALSGNDRHGKSADRVLTNGCSFPSCFRQHSG